MKKTVLTLTLCLAAMLSAGSRGFAQTSSDVGTWLSAQAVKSWGGTYAMARLEHRSFENMGATECWFAMAGLGYRFAPWLKGDVSYEFWKIPASGNVTTQKAVFCLTGTLQREGLAVSLREKFELAFAEGSSSPAGTLRTRLRAQYAIPSSAFTPYVMVEYFNGFSGSLWQRSLHYAGTEIRLSKHHSLDFFYMYHLFPKGSEISCCHLLGAGYILSL